MHKLTIICVIVLNLIYLAKSGEFITKDGFQYYYSYPLRLNWHRAFRYCTYHGMYLVDFHTEDEYHRVANIIKNHREQLNITEHYDVWTSGTELGSEGQHYWETTGHAVQFSLWAPNEPNNWNNSQDCLSLHSIRDFLMIDRECKLAWPFICRDKAVLAETLKNKQSNCIPNFQSDN